ncbi:MAG: hypothetical protein GW822_15295 [Sphingomonadales bacterium]|nr:hypothetical protein [Sphingomonadales bacterium]
MRKIIFEILSVFLAWVAFTSAGSAKGFGEITSSHATEHATTCKLQSYVPYEALVLKEIFPKVIDKTPGRDVGSAQLFEPIRKIAEPLAILGTRCLMHGGDSKVSPAGAKADGGGKSADDSCNIFANWVEELVKQDALRFDRDKHRRSPVSFVTGALSGNLTIRPIALYAGALRDAGLIHLRSNSAFDEWLLRRVADYDNFPARLTPAAAQNLVMNSVLAKLTVGITVGNPQPALNEGAEVYKLYLDTARADGSFPAETRRGVSALKYSNMATGGLVIMAELATMEGRDLYQYRSPGGVDIHQSVGFVAKSILDESGIAEYAKENYAPTDKIEGSVQARHFIRDHAGWMSIYMRRFPKHENTKLLGQIMQSERVRFSGYYDEILGAMAGCVW